jgi:hypothetical protein
MAWSHEGSTEKIENVARRRSWKPGKRRRFHDWLSSTYPYEKDQMSEQRLYDVALEFERSDSDRWDD